MGFIRYQRLASRTINNDSTQKEKLSNFAMGLAGESGELIDHLKKHLFHGHPIDIDEVEKELGDIMWYVAGIASSLDLQLDQIAERNIRKLEKRYPEGFSEEDSLNRDTTDE